MTNDMAINEYPRTYHAVYYNLNADKLLLLFLSDEDAVTAKIVLLLHLVFDESDRFLHLLQNASFKGLVLDDFLFLPTLATVLS